MLDYFIIKLFICIYVKVRGVCSKSLILKSYIIRFNNCDIGHDSLDVLGTLHTTIGVTSIFLCLLCSMLFLDKVLFVLITLVVIISGYMTMMHIVYGYNYTSYDNWIFGMNLALLLGMYDNHL